MSSSAPVVAIVGPFGFIGDHVTPAFVKAAKGGEVARLKILSSDPSRPLLQQYASDAPQQVELVQADYKDVKSLERTLQGVDILVSSMGMQGDFATSKESLIHAAANAGVKIYIPSEWGTDHHSTKREHPMFTAKQHHHAAAEALGLKVVAIYTSLILETSFCKWFAESPSTRIDSASSTWAIPGDGSQPVALTSQRDLGPYAVHAVLLAYSDPTKVPSHLRVCSDNRSWNEYADIMEGMSGIPIKREYVPLEEAERKYEAVRANIAPHMLGPLIPIMSAEGTFDHSVSSNELLNPGQKYFVPRKVDEYAKEVGGRPWLNGDPFSPN